MNNSNKYCSCYYCMNTYESNKVKEFYDNGKTAVCPLCNIDSVIYHEDKTIDRLLLVKNHVKSFCWGVSSQNSDYLWIPTAYYKNVIVKEFGDKYYKYREAV